MYDKTLYLSKVRTTHVHSRLLLCVIPVLFYDALCFLEVFLLGIWLPPFHTVAVLVKLSTLRESYSCYVSATVLSEQAQEEEHW
jgi:hypothetical protein